MPTAAVDASVIESIPPVADEAARSLDDLAHGKTGRIPVNLLVRHILRVYRDAGWPVQRGAMEALLRRIAFARRDRLRIGTRPRGSAAYGTYSTRRGGARGRVRAWRTRLDSIDPEIAASCDCPDFLRGSLGLCKHVLVVLDELSKRRRSFEAIRKARRVPRRGGSVEWDPIRPLLGAGDPLQRLRIVCESSPDAAIRRLLVADTRAGWRLARLDTQDPARRLELVRALRTWIDRAAIDAGPAVHRLLADEEQRLVRIEESRGTAQAASRSLRSLRGELHPYQRQGVEQFLQTGRLLLADDMGLGKTVQAIACCHALWSTGAVKRGLVVVPASLKTQWLREWRAWTDAPIALLDGSPSERAVAWHATRSGFLLVNYEQVIRDHDHVLRWRPDLAILDEAQRIKNWETKSAECVKALQPTWRLVLTGTPMENRLEELASLVDWVDDHALEPKWRLGPLHAIAADGKRRAVGARHLDVLRQRLAPCFLRRVRHDVLKQLPARTNTLVPVELTGEQKDEHDSLAQPIATLLGAAAKRPLRREEFLRLMQLLNTQRMIANALAQVNFEQVWPALCAAARPTPELLASLYSPKLLQLRDILSALIVDQERKVVVFSQWRRMLLLAEWSVRDLLADAGLRAVFFTGHESQKRRTHNLVDFHDERNTRVLFASDAGGIGLNLQRAASACVNLELPWNPAVLEQRVGRIHRMGQKQPIDVFNLVAQGCIEQGIASLVSGKQALFRELFDGASDELRFEGSASFLENLQRVSHVEPDPRDVLPRVADEQDGESEGDEGGDPAQRGIEELLERADEGSGDAETPNQTPTPTSATDGSASPLPSGTSDTALEMLQRVTVHRDKDGSLTLRAPPEAASTLAQLFSQFARLLASAGS